MIIFHVYSVTLANPETLDAHSETVIAMNTGEAREKVEARWNVPAEESKKLVWHVHEITKFTVREDEPELEKGKPALSKANVKK